MAIYTSMSPYRRIVIDIRGRKYRIPVSPSITIPDVEEAMSNTQRLLCLTIYAYTELARSYSREVADVLRRYNVIPQTREKNIRMIQKKLDYRLYEMLNGRQQDFLRDYADILYGGVQSELSYLQSCVEHLYGNDTLARPKSFVHILYNLVEYINKAYDALMREMNKIYKINFYKCFESWKVTDVLKWCEKLCVETGVHSDEDCVDKKSSLEQAKYAFENFITCLSDYNMMKQAQFEALDELPEDIKKQFKII